MRKRKLTPERRSRLPRFSISEDWRQVLAVVNGQVRRPQRYEPERSRAVATLDAIIKRCDEIETALAGYDIARHYDVPIGTIRIGKRRDRINHAMGLASGLGSIILGGGVQTRFAVTVEPVRSTDNDVVGSWRSNRLPPADELFSLKDVLMLPEAKDIGEQFAWQFMQAITKLDDLRRLRKCDGDLHDGRPFYFIAKKVQRREHYFCDDPCRSDFNYKKKIQMKEQRS